MACYSSWACFILSPCLYDTAHMALIFSFICYFVSLKHFSSWSFWFTFARINQKLVESFSLGPALEVVVYTSPLLPIILSMWLFLKRWIKILVQYQRLLYLKTSLKIWSWRNFCSSLEQKSVSSYSLRLKTLEPLVLHHLLGNIL